MIFVSYSEASSHAAYGGEESEWVGKGTGGGKLIYQRGEELSLALHAIEVA